MSEKSKSKSTSDKSKQEKSTELSSPNPKEKKEESKDTDQTKSADKVEKKELVFTAEVFSRTRSDLSRRDRYAIKRLFSKKEKKTSKEWIELFQKHGLIEKTN